jgi:CRISPR-associated protein Csd2
MNAVTRQAIANRYEFVFLFDVTNGNPNGDPDAGNLPRLDPETNQGIVTDVCLKRKIRNFIALAQEGEPRYGVYVQEGAVLNEQHRLAYRALRGEDDAEVNKRGSKLSPKDPVEEAAVRRFMCDNFFDVRTFGAVMSTGVNCGQVRGPVQLTFAQSIEPVLPLEISITRMAATTTEGERKEQKAKAGNKAGKAAAESVEGAESLSEERMDNRTMGRKHIIPYGLYRAHGFVSAHLARETGFDETDLENLWTALENMFDHDRSAARGEMNARKLIVFKHDNALGKAPAHQLFDRIKVERVIKGDNAPPARAFTDYEVTVLRENPPAGVEIIERL